MIKIISNQNIEVSSAEWKYYLEIENSFGQNALRGMFEADKKGQILFVRPPVGKPTSMILIFFLLNVQLNQKLRRLTDGLMDMKDLKEKVDKLEKKLKEL
tara:strand:+ start:1598 stop:1897 length:300 start_codon:yes stop_codon:yes gene_type:complete